MKRAIPLRRANTILRRLGLPPLFRGERGAWRWDLALSAGQVLRPVSTGYPTVRRALYALLQVSNKDWRALTPVQQQYLRGKYRPTLDLTCAHCRAHEVRMVNLEEQEIWCRVCEAERWRIVERGRR